MKRIRVDRYELFKKRRFPARSPRTPDTVVD